ncbi:MAG: peptidase BlaR1, partial [Anaerocolumna sp.]|nr:peptidase BlaR1 [Anaerocolumna sp.]
MIETDVLVWLFKSIIYLAATGSVLIILLLVLKKIFHRALSPKWHYYIWIVLLIRLIIPFEPESSFSIYNVFYSVAERMNLPITESFTPMQTGLPGTIIPGQTPSNVQPNQPQDDTGKNPSGNIIPDKDIAEGGVNHSESGSIIEIAALLWLGGVIILTVYTFWINIAFAINVRRRYTPLRDLRIERILKSCKENLSIGQKIPLLTSKKVRTPSLYGLFHPCILVSESYMEKLNDDEIKYIFLHELSHYKRKDIAVNWLLTCLQIIYFFNPLTWYAFYKIHEDCEISCDAEALKYLKEEEYQQYGSTIIKLIRLFSESNFIPTTAGISKNKSSYKRRIIMISRFKTSKWIGTFLSLIIIVVVAAVGLTGCKTTPGTPQENTIPSTPPENTSAT